jgi:hypothetical protein
MNFKSFKKCFSENVDSSKQNSVLRPMIFYDLLYYIALIKFDNVDYLESETDILKYSRDYVREIEKNKFMLRQVRNQ